MLSPWWTRPRWLHRLLTRRAAATIVTNEHFAEIIRDLGGKALVLPDIPTSHDTAPVTLGSEANITVVSTFAADEPLTEVLSAAAALPDVQFHVTGDPRRAPEDVIDSAPPNVRFTGFLPDGEFYGLLSASHAVMCLTTRDHTMQCGACEALSLGTPIITSDWPVLRSYFHAGTVHVDNTAAGIRTGVAEMLQHHDGYRQGIVTLQEAQQRAWTAGQESLLRLLGEDRQDAPVVTQTSPMERPDPRSGGAHG
jgi:glycosyltransferase involved in cell wall biosynthesis